jgi:radical SAM protein with 4Fe4S-binding SPASM domain
VDADGSIYLCGACDVQRKTYLGNIFDEGLEKIYKEGGILQMIIESQGENDYFECCRKCSEWHPCEAKVFMEYSKLHKWSW